MFVVGLRLSWPIKELAGINGGPQATWVRSLIRACLKRVKVSPSGAACHFLNGSGRENGLGRTPQPQQVKSHRSRFAAPVLSVSKSTSIRHLFPIMKRSCSLTWRAQSVSVMVFGGAASSATSDSRALVAQTQASNAVRFRKRRSPMARFPLVPGFWASTPRARDKDVGGRTPPHPHPAVAEARRARHTAAPLSVARGQNPRLRRIALI